MTDSELLLIRKNTVCLHRLRPPGDPSEPLVSVSPWAQSTLQKEKERFRVEE